jgi:two-component system response regulator
MPARIVIIEDNEIEVWLLRQALEQAGEDYVLESLRDGEEALRFVQDQRSPNAEPEPCVIVLDLHLPKYDGAAVLRAIREEPVLAHVSVIIVTTLASPRQEAEVRELGVRLFRTRPKTLDDYAMLAKEIMDICHEASIA